MSRFRDVYQVETRGRPDFHDSIRIERPAHPLPSPVLPDDPLLFVSFAKLGAQRRFDSRLDFNRRSKRRSGVVAKRNENKKGEKKKKKEGNDESMIERKRRNKRGGGERERERVCGPVRGQQITTRGYKSPSGRNRERSNLRNGPVIRPSSHAYRATYSLRINISPGPGRTRTHAHANVATYQLCIVCRVSCVVYRVYRVCPLRCMVDDTSVVIVSRRTRCTYGVRRMVRGPGASRTCTRCAGRRDATHTHAHTHARTLSRACHPIIGKSTGAAHLYTSD